MSDQLPPCGIYRTLQPVGSVEAGRLVYYHNHGNPGPGVYFPERWTHNKAQWSEGGVTVPDGFDYKGLMPLPAEGFYRVMSAFHCCEKQCTKFEADTFVQLGYNGAGRAILFVPELAASGLHIPDRGSILDDKVLVNLSPLKVPAREARNDLALPRGMIVH